MADQHKNFAYSTVATAPSPASSGTSLVVAAGHGTLFPTAPFNCTVWPAGSQPTAANAEIVRVTNVSTDTFTIVRTQESTSARSILVGDQIAATITAKTLTDVEALQGSGAPGYEIGYDAVTSGTVTVTSTTEATGTTIIACAAHTFDGGLVEAEFFCPAVGPGASAGAECYVSLFEGATQIQRIAAVVNPVAAALYWSLIGKIRFTPSAASHTYTVTGHRVTANCAFLNDVGGTAKFGAMYIRFTKV